MCPNCNLIQLKGKQKFCSDKCRKQFARRLQKGDEVGQINSDIPTRTLETNATRTDKLFEAWRPNWYNFSKSKREAKCFVCGKDFETHLQLLKTCSPKCFRKMLDLR